MLPGGYSAKSFAWASGLSTPEALRARDRRVFTSIGGTRRPQVRSQILRRRKFAFIAKGKSPIVGKQLGAAALPENSSVWTWEPAASDVSNSDDLGYTYGSYKITTGGSQVVEAGNYLRIWKKVGAPGKFCSISQIRFRLTRKRTISGSV